MSHDPSHPDFLYALLPELHRARDPRPEQPLRALLRGLQAEHQRVHRRISDDLAGWFIETCEAERVPRLGALFGLAPELATRRAFVAQAVGLYQRKGTPAALERAVEAASGWAASLSADERALRVTPRRVEALRGAQLFPVGGQAGAFTLDPWGDVAPLCHRPSPVPLGARRPGWDHPVMLSADALRTEVAALQAGTPPSTAYLRGLEVHLLLPGGRRMALNPARMQLGSLETWRRPDGRASDLLLDPARGRVSLADSLPATGVLLSAGVAADLPLGAGPPGRPAWIHEAGPPIGVRGGGDALAQALTQTPAASLRLDDGLLYALPADALDLQGGALVLCAAQGQRPALTGDLRLTTPPERPARLVLDGLLLVGRLLLDGPIHVTLRRCTLRAGAAEPSVQLRPRDGECGALEAEGCVLGAVEVAAEATRLALDGCVLGVDGAAALSAGVAARLEACTLLGATTLAADSQLEECVFAATPQAADTSGVRFTRCGLPALPPGAEDADCQRLTPGFVSRAVHHPDFVRLSDAELLEASLGGGAIGARRAAGHTQALRAAEAVFEEFVPAGLSGHVALEISG
ncbi:MAG: hypothetical protein H6741_31815 [Alphaproteobacteria bacterium]|nr:hypothetical protein [Alphaproteobacteria bacterium]